MELYKSINYKFTSEGFEQNNFMIRTSNALLIQHFLLIPVTAVNRAKSFLKLKMP